MEKELKIEYVPLSEIIPYDKNPRKNDKAVKIVKKSIQEYGFLNPIILDNKNEIVAGHTRFRAALELGLKAVPIIWADELTPEQVKAFRIMDNKSTEYAKWDFSMLKEEFIELQDISFDLSITGFSDSEINRILTKASEEPNKGNKEPKYQIKQGEVYKLGSHILVCGDSTDPKNYDYLDDKPACVYTDPPYGVSYSGTNNPNGREWNVIEGDNLRSDDLYNLLYNSFKLIEPKLKQKAAIYVFHASINQIIFEKALRDAGFKVKQQLIWEKHHVLGHSHYHWSHEPCFYGCRIKEEPEFYGERVDKTIINKIDTDSMTEKQLRDFLKGIIDAGTILKFKRDDTKEYIHPTQKPVQMAERLILNSSKAGETILEPFGGSGSTLIACERQARKCYLIEMDPTFCSHIIERWEKETGGLHEKLR